MDNATSVPQQTVVVILAAGKGTRMGRPDIGKVCFEIDGVPAINRTLTTFRRLRFARFMVVVGSHAGQVMETVSRAYPEALYVFQSPQLGTGHAARVAAEALEAMDCRAPVLVTLGDKYIEDAAIAALVDGYVKQQADLALLTIPKARGTEDCGRVVLDASGQALDIIERSDLARQAVADELGARLEAGRAVTGDLLRSVIARHIPKPSKQESAVGDLLALAQERGRIARDRLARILRQPPYNLTVGGRRYTARDVDRRCRSVNPSLYLFRPGAFRAGTSMLTNDNAQGEYYLTDVVKHLSASRAPAFRVRTVHVPRPEWIQGFNSPDDLLAIQDYVRRRKLEASRSPAPAAAPRLKPSQYAAVSQWLRKIEANGPPLRRWMLRIYGRNEALHDAKRRDLARALRCYAGTFGADARVCVVRAPGRINLMGRHVDHRGAHNNLLAIDRETIAVVGPRTDDRVVAVNVEPQPFPRVEFGIAEVMGEFAWSDWVNFVNSDWVRNMLLGAPGNWGNYLKAAVLRLQHRFKDVKVRGMNLALYGNVPIAAGLSSSSTLVVAALQAAIALNGFDLTSRQFIDLCGEGEWFVGSRGGAGDHAAIYLGQRGRIAHVGFLPFRIDRVFPAPAGCRVIVADSHIKAAKSGAAKDTFNEKICSYNLGLVLLKQRCPEAAPLIEHLRDLSPAKLGCPTSDIYRMLLKVPETLTRPEFRAALGPAHHDLAEANFATHADPRRYDVRGVLLFGAAESLRSECAADVLASGNVEGFGQLMKISHDGDRVSQPGPDGTYVRVKGDASDACLNQLIADLHSEDPGRVTRAQLYMQPGCYACSRPEIDRMVDIACAVPGVIGAQLAGAGLGGCIMILARDEAVGAVERALLTHYYRPNRLQPAVVPCTVVDGAGLVDV